ncbi:MFS transporter [Nonomuraea endophytica]|uniref:MFS family permease n=1 Tax=Nonomuraea endophytica TaxID=714136 RepID=A0A7W8AC82_9ACTN|nr:MFS transporter [Nonomuraea endophytica]MBB5083443.1 MFS family permease [Nonomuraea endophytica]
MNATSADRRYALVSFLTWLPAGLMIAPLVLLMLGRGLTIVQVGVVMTVYSLVIAVLELPTGGLADVVGRRAVLALAAACTALSLGLLVLATSFWAFVLACGVLGVSRALSSGPAEAWYVDTLHAVEGPEADLRPGLARGHVMEDVALGVGVLAGGFVPLLDLPLDLPLGLPTLPALAVPPLAGAVAALVWLGVVLVALPEPPHPRVRLGEVLRGVPLTVASGVRVAVGDGVLRRLVLLSAVVGMALTCVELLVPGHLAALTGSAELGATAYAVVAAVGFAGGALGSGLAPALARRLAGREAPGAKGSVRGAVAGLVLCGVSLAGLALSALLGGGSGVGSVVLAGLPYAVLFVGLGAYGVLRAELSHHRVTAAERATMASAASLAGSGGAALANLTLAPLAMGLGTAAAWWLVAAVVLLSSLLFFRLPIKERTAL